MKPPYLGRLRTCALVLVLGAGPVTLAHPARVLQAGAQDAAKEKLAAIDKDFEQENKDLRAVLKEAESDEARSELYADFSKSIVADFAKRYAALAQENKGSPIALQAWTKAFELGARYQNGDIARQALAALTSDHLQSEELAGLTMNLRYNAQSIGEEIAIGALKTLSERSPHRAVQGAARYSLGAVLAENRPAGDPKLVEARQVLESVKKDFSDLDYYNGQTYGQAASAFLFELDHLQLGMAAPDFDALDAEGAKFKLSDYKGKVVLVDFWGFW